MPEPSDAEFWQRIRADDPQAFGDLFRRHGPTIHRYLLRRTADAHGAEDLAATVFLEAWRQRHRVELRQPSALPWLYGVATNLLRSNRRLLTRDAALAGRLAALPPTDPTTVERQVEAAEEARVLLAQMTDLPRRQLDVLVLVAWEGLSISEASVALDVPPGTVKSRLSRARARLAADDLAPTPDPAVVRPSPPFTSRSPLAQRPPLAHEEIR
jgi:RNA polymerase sigma factor (sigma-70 family)